MAINKKSSAGIARIIEFYHAQTVMSNLDWIPVKGTTSLSAKLPYNNPTKFHVCGFVKGEASEVWIDEEVSFDLPPGLDPEAEPIQYLGLKSSDSGDGHCNFELRAYDREAGLTSLAFPGNPDGEGEVEIWLQVTIHER